MIFFRLGVWIDTQITGHKHRVPKHRKFWCPRWPFSSPRPEMVALRAAVAGIGRGSWVQVWQVRR